MASATIDQWPPLPFGRRIIAFAPTGRGRGFNLQYRIVAFQGFVVKNASNTRSVRLQQLRGLHLFHWLDAGWSISASAEFSSGPFGPFGSRPKADHFFSATRMQTPDQRIMLTPVVASADFAQVCCGERIPSFEVITHNLCAGIGRG